MKRRDFLKQSAFALAGLAMLSLGCGSDKTAKADAPQPEVKQSTNEGASQAMNHNGKKNPRSIFFLEWQHQSCC